jgi:hypothetical protein
MVKEIAVSGQGRYNGSRNLHFCGKLLTPEEKEAKNAQTGDTSTPYPFDTAEVVGGAVVRECKCFTDRLTLAPESISAFLDYVNATPEERTEATATFSERLNRPEVVTVRIRDLVIPANIRINPFEGIEQLLFDVKAADGIREPVKVRSTGSGELVLMEGFRRVYCAIALGIREVPAFLV